MIVAHPIKRREGQRYGRLVVLSQAPTTARNASWRCQCDCGTTIIVRADMLQNGYTKSCGCLRRDSAVMNATAGAVRLGETMQALWEAGVYDHLRGARVDKANKKSARHKKLDVVFTNPSKLSPEDRPAGPKKFDESAAVDLAKAMGLL